MIREARGSQLGSSLLAEAGGGDPAAVQPLESQLTGKLESTPRGGVNRCSSLKTCTQKTQLEAAWRTVRWECPLGTSNVRWEVSGMECNLSKNKTCIPKST
jgi:hypothetical protein